MLCDHELKRKHNQNNRPISAENEHWVKPNENISHNYVSGSESKSNTTGILLQVLKVRISGKVGTTETYALFDTGSDKSYITQHLIEKIGPEWLTSQQVASATFGQSKVEPRNIYQVRIKDGEREMTVCITETPTFCTLL